MLDNNAEEINMLNIDICSINYRYNVEFPMLQINSDNNDWRTEAKNHYRTLRKNVQNKINRQEADDIKQAIEKRCAYIKTDPKKMLNSLLNRHRQTIVVDRLIKTDIDGESSLITDPDNINKEAASVFEKQFKKRNNKFDELNHNPKWELWHKIYKEKRDITPNEDIYLEINSKPTPEEWESTLSNCSNKSAPALSGIGYTIIKQLPDHLNECLRLLAHKCFTISKIPDSWKLSQIFPIPKPTDWQYNLSETRPILLIECIRKVIVRIMNNRLSNVFKQHEVLSKHNFAGLKGDCTNNPVQIMNNLIEDSNSNKKELWLALQDMRKAFDSVSLVSLRAALTRLSVPQDCTNFIIDLYENRRMSVITRYGTSDSFTAGDGIDQGESISPLMWRVFYDPLITHVQSTNLGYPIKSKWPSKTHMTALDDGINIAVLAYADDTVWVSNSKDNMDQIIKLTNQFFELNDIQINGKKSELLVFNQENPNTIHCITMGRDNTVIENAKNSQPVRYLGVFFTRSKQEQHIRNRARNIIKNTATTLANKKFTLAHIRYINNMVLIPQVNYITQTTLLTDSQGAHIHRPIITLAKRKSGLAITTENNIIFHEFMGNFRRLSEVHKEQQIQNFFKYINNDYQEITFLTTWMRIEDAQLAINSPTPIFKLDKNDIAKYSFRHNLAANIIQALTDHEFTLSTPLMEQRLTLSHTGTPLRIILERCFEKDDSIEEPTRKRLRKDLIKFSKVNIFTDHDVINHGSNEIFEWHPLTRIKEGRSIRGPTPTIYKLIQKLTQEENSTVQSISSTNLPPHKTFTIPSNSPFISLKTPTRDKRRKEWVSFRRFNNTYYGKISHKVGQDTQSLLCTITHWVKTEHSNAGELAPKDKLYLTECKGCEAFDCSDRDNDNKTTTCTTYAHVDQLTDIGQVIALNDNDKNQTLPHTRKMKPLTPFHMLENIRYMDQILNIPSHPLPSISLYNNRDEQLLRDNISEDAIFSQLHRILQLHQLEITEKGPDHIFEIFTDGSAKLIKHRDAHYNTTDMGIGWINVNNEDINFNCKIRNWPSSTRAELAAIWTALATIPESSTVRIMTDSQASIDAISSTTDTRLNTKEAYLTIQKYANPSLLRAIKTLINTKKLEIQLIKVRGHSGIRGNELADNMAEEGISGILLRLDNINHNNLENKTEINWRGFRLERPLRNFLKNYHKTINHFEWMQNRAIRDSVGVDINREVNIMASWLSINAYNNTNCLSLSDNQHLIFLLKLLNNLLPTNSLLNERNPNHNITCELCNLNTPETLEHILICDGLVDEREITFTLTKEAIIDPLDNLKENMGITKLKLNEIHNFIDDLWDADYSIKLDYIKGFYSQHIVNDLNKIVRSESNAIAILTIFTNNLQITFRKIMWNGRCDKVQEKPTHNSSQIYNKKEAHKTRSTKPKPTNVNNHDTDSQIQDNLGRIIVSTKDKRDLATKRTNYMFKNKIEHGTEPIHAIKKEGFKSVYAKVKKGLGTAFGKIKTWKNRNRVEVDKELHIAGNSDNRGLRVKKNRKNFIK
jgi:ribonuclease HI